MSVNAYQRLGKAEEKTMLEPGGLDVCTGSSLQISFPLNLPRWLTMQYMKKGFKYSQTLALEVRCTDIKDATDTDRG